MQKKYFIDASSLIISVIAIFVALYTLWKSELYLGQLNISQPSHIGVTRAMVFGRYEDKLFLSFTIHNDGNKIRSIKKISLIVNDANFKEECIFQARGIFNILKDVVKYQDGLSENKYAICNTRYNPVVDNPNFSHLTIIPVDRKTIIPLNLLFFDVNEKFKFNSNLFYTGLIKVETIDDIYYSDRFYFCEKIKSFVPLKYAIDLNFIIANSIFPLK